METTDDKLDSMEAESLNDDNDVRTITDTKGRTFTIRINERLKIEPTGALKRHRPRSNSDEDNTKKVGIEATTEHGVSEILQLSSSDETTPVRDALIEAVLSVNRQIGRMEAALHDGDETALRKILRSLKYDSEIAVTESHKVGRTCKKCEGGLPTANSATQTPRKSDKLPIDEIRRILENGAEDNQVLQVITSKWPEEAFQNVKLRDDSPFESKGDIAVVFDLATADAAYKNKIFRAAPGVKARSRDGELTCGQLVMEGHSSTDLLGETDEKVDRVFTIVVDSSKRDEVETATDIRKALRRLKEYRIVKFLATDDNLGQLTRKILEYEARRTEVEVSLKLEKRLREVKQANNQVVPATRFVVKVAGRSYADLLRDLKKNITKEETGDVLSVKKGPKDELLLTLKAGKAVEDIKNAIGNKVEGAVVKEAGRRIPPVPYHVKDMDFEATADDIREGFKVLIGEEEIRVGALRPAFGGTQSATVLVPGLAAKKLKDVSRIQVGWVCCRLIQRESEARCYRCWEFGHTASGCKGEDRTKLCFNCGREGHVIATCEFSVRCVACGKEGHKMGNRSCQKAGH